MRIRIAAVLFALLAVSPLHAAIRGTVMTFDGVPIAAARVAAYAPENEAGFRARLVSEDPKRKVLVETTTDAKGAFSLDAGKSGTFDVAFEASGYAPSQIRALADFDFGAIPLRATAMKTARVSAGGKPVSGARVVWRLGNGTQHLAMTDEEGRYQAPDPDNIPVFLTMVHPDWSIFAQEPQLVLSGRRSLDIAATSGIALRGRVVGTDRKSGVAGATVIVDGWPLTKSGDDGAFEIPHASASWKELSAATSDRYGVRTRGGDGAVTIVLTPPATISGVVTDSRTNRPLAGAEVALSTERFDPSSGPSVFTDAKGAYRFPRLVPGAFSISVRMRDYDSSRSSVALREGDRLTKNLPARPLAQVAGSVLDEDKRPVAAARVAFESAGERMPQMMAMRRSSGYAAPDGRFVVHDVVVDEDVRLGAEKPGNPRAESDSMRLSPGERKTGVVLTVPRGLEVSGTVADRDGRGVAGATVEFNETQEAAARMVFLNRLEGTSAPRTAKDGTFKVRVKQGKYDLVVRAEGYAPRRLPGIAVEAAMKPLEVVLDPGVEIAGRVVRDGVGVEGAMVSAFTPLTGQIQSTTLPDGSFTLTDLAPGPTNLIAFSEGATQPTRQSVTAPARDVVIEFPRGGTVRGRVVDKATGGPITNFQVHISGVRSGAGMLMGGPGTRKDFHTDDGNFVMEGVAAGPVDISVTAAGYARGRVPGLRVEESKPLVDVEVALEVGGRLVGRVTAPDGSPVDGATITRVVESQGQRLSGFSDEPRAQTDANGDYVLDSLEAGEGHFTVAKRGFVTETKPVNVAGREARLDVRLSRGVTLAGTVTSSAGTPVPNAAISASSSAVDASPGRASTDAQGNFRIEGVAPGRYQIRVQKSGFAARTLRDVDAETAGHLRIVLESGGVIYGTVRGLSPEELTAVTVSAATSQGRVASSADSNGNYRIEGVGEGTATVSAFVRGASGSKSSPAKNVEVVSGSDVMVDIEFKAGTTVSGRVTRMGRPETNATIVFSPASPNVQTRASASLDQQGAYSVSGLEDGDYTVRVVNMERLTPYTTRHEVRGSGTFDIDMRGGTLRGRVVDDGTGEGIVEVQITLQPIDVEGETFLSSFTAVSDAAGEFVIEMIAPGRYSARAQKASLGHQAVDIEINDSDSNVVELKLRKEAGLTIRALDARSGRTIEPWITVRDAGNRVVFDSFQQTDSDGLVRIPVSTGAYRLSVSSNGYASQVLRAQAPSQEIRVAMTPGGSIAVESSFAERRAIRLIDATGADYLEDLDFYGGGRLNPGKSTMPNIAPGAYTLQILGLGGQVEKSVPVNVQEGQVTEIRI
jgi:protocatechuate 3,4-dioxygenase beta subunit